MPIQPPPPYEPPGQVNLFPDLPPPATSSGSHSAQSAAAPTAQYRRGELAPVWLQRLNLIIHVMFCLYLGVVVAALPWWRNVWDRNLFLLAHPVLWRFLMLGPVRGVVSGIGVLDIWIGLSAALHYRDVRAVQPRDV
jgi:hypothetical protein